MSRKIGFILTTDGGKLFKTQEKYGEFFRNRFANVDNSLDYEVFFGVTGPLPNITDFKEFAGFVLTGSRFSVNDDKQWIRDLQAFILQVDEYNKSEPVHEVVKLFGLCYGHQLIAKAFGGAVDKNINGTKYKFGPERVDVGEGLSQKRWYKEVFGDRTYFTINQSHSEEITDLPINIQVVGKSQSCLNEVCFYGDNIMSVQGHPEDGLVEVRDIKLSVMIKSKRVEQEQSNEIIEQSKDLDSVLLLKMILSYLLI